MPSVARLLCVRAMGEGAREQVAIAEAVSEPELERGERVGHQGDASAPGVVSSFRMSPAPRSSDRLRSLDVFRGATIALMILVNNAGDWGKTFAPLLHAEWNGWTPTDLVFPFFLFIVGVAVPFAFARALDGGPEARTALRRKILKRSALLFGLGLFLIWYPFYTVHWERFRIPGVLQRIAIVYLVAALAYLRLGPRGRLVLSTLLLGGYWAAMRLVPVPGYGAGDLSPEGNLAFHVDHLVLGAHHWLYSPVRAIRKGSCRRYRRSSRRSPESSRASGSAPARATESACSGSPRPASRPAPRACCSRRSSRSTRTSGRRPTSSSPPASRSSSSRSATGRSTCAAGSAGRSRSASSAATRSSPTSAAD